MSCLVILSMSFGGCRKAGQTSLSADSTVIKEIEAMQERGSQYRNESRFDEAIATHDSCITMAEEIKDTIQLVIALNNQGTNYRRLSAMKEASDYHYRALALCDVFSDTTTFLAKKNRVRSLNGLGNIMMSLGNNDAAENMFRKALAGEHALGSATGQAINLANIGSIKAGAGQTDSARFYYRKSLRFNEKDSNDVGICLCYSYLGELDQKEGHVQNALSNFRQSYLIGKTTGDIWHWLTPCISLAKLYLSTNNTDSAITYINRGMSAADSIHSNEHLAELFSLRSELNEKQGNASQALADLRRYRMFNDSIQSEEARNSVQNLRVNYEANRRIVEVNLAEADAETSRVVRNVVIVASILIILLIGTALFFRHRSREAKEKAVKERETFYRNVTHQLRTPMTVVLGTVEQLSDHIPASDVLGHENLDAARRQSKNLLELIQKLIAASKEGKDDLLTSQGDLTPQKQTSTTLTDKAAKIKKEFHSMYNDSDENAKPHILIAEDTDDVAMMMATLLHEHGYDVHRAADGQEALEMLHQNELPDLLLTDIAMPRMDGLELMRHVREDDTMCHLPIIVASARVEDSERMEGISAGAEVYLTKPFNPQELLLRVEKILEQRERLRRSFSHDDSAKSEKKVDTPQMTQEEKAFIDSLDKCIDDHMMSGDVNITYLADMLCTSPSSITRKVKNITGMPAATYIRTRRLLMAKKLLTTTDKSITDIELLCGFNTQGHFSRLFKSETGMSPSEYRQKNR